MNWSIGREHSWQVKHFLWYTCRMEIIFSASKTLPLHRGQALASSSPAWTVQVSNCAPSKNLGFELPLNRKIISLFCIYFFCMFAAMPAAAKGDLGNKLAWQFFFLCMKTFKKIFTEVCHSKHGSKFCHQVRRKLKLNPKVGCKGCIGSNDDGTIQKLPPFFRQRKLFRNIEDTWICPYLQPWWKSYPMAWTWKWPCVRV